MNSNLSTTANFESGTAHVLNVSPEGGNSPDQGDRITVGSASCSVDNGCSFDYAGGAPGSVTITATTDNCSVFEGFTGPCGSNDLPDECTVDPAAMQTTTVFFEFMPKPSGSGSGAQCVVGS